MDLPGIEPGVSPLPAERHTVRPQALPKTPQPGFEPGYPKGQEFQSCAIPDYAIAAKYVNDTVLVYKCSLIFWSCPRKPK